MFQRQRGFLYIILAFFIVSGCSVGSQGMDEIKSIEDVDINSITEYSGTYVGDQSKVSSLLRELAGGETVDRLDLTGEKISVTYKVNESISQESFDSYWFNGEDSEREIFYFNALYLSVLVPNAKDFNFRIEGSEMNVTRELLVDALSGKFVDFPLENKAWDQKVVKAFIQNHKGEVEEMARNNKNYFE
ncbi:DUF4825 domain-containing protein [Guptibacillus hwajinpoensis]|uniref:DUF4825 domain-containing protein n=1 Tax=Guptibacillus hwajinpoensis TaxID=208199 RepID=A0ABU0K531_9BACL|nr:DUF4825 domain-containing protein [Alkalihalobacillus hemicentroti]MDQ0483790.1 hypothetical protein [Alkalihalobacillus hemicentroti]